MTYKPEEVGLSGERLAGVQRHLSERYLRPGKIAGSLTLVWRQGRVAYLSPLGMMDREREKTMQEDTIFRIYSMTKPITSVALMMLYEQGHFQLDEAVYKKIPALRELRVYQSGNHPLFLTRAPDRDLTIRDLLRHTSGFTYGFMERTNVDRAYRKLGIYERCQNLQDFIEQLAQVPLEFSPGACWNYGVSTDVVGYLVEVISGQSLDQFFRQRIFEPLGMKDTGFYLPPDKLGRFAAAYGRSADKKLQLLDDPLQSSYASPPGLLSGGAGLVSTAGDYLRFCRMLLNGGELDGARILGRKTLELMTMNHLPGGRLLPDMSVSSFSQIAPEGMGFGLGFSVIMDVVDSAVVGSAGTYNWGGYASTEFWIDPKEDMIVIFLVQFLPALTFNFVGQLKSIIYSALVDRPPHA